jgi:cytochrome oxidase Cu insertion factor (SCO1/SenC/PrrC family)
MTIARTRRPGLAFTTLAAILVVTAAWWALALWPVGAASPAWLVQTRAVCFGTAATGLPDAGGWILLIGEPFGMLVALWVMWGESLRADFAHLVHHPLGRLAGAVMVLAVVVGMFAAGRRVADAKGVGQRGSFVAVAPLPPRTRAIAPMLTLVDQHARTTTLGDVSGQWAIVTFAFGHCETMCPLIVHDVLRARRDQKATDVPLFVVTLDPWRDTPDRLASMAAAWELEPTDRVLSGSIASVNATLDTWGIARRRDENTGNIEHGSTVVVIDPGGHVAWRIEGSPYRVADALKQR